MALPPGFELEPRSANLPSGFQLETGPSAYGGVQFPVKLGAEGMAESLRQEAASRGAVPQAIAGVGTAVNDAAMRLKQLTGNTLTPAEIADITAGRQLRNVSTPAMAGGVGGQVAMTYPIAPTTLLGNVAAGGVLASLLNPVLPGESAWSNMKAGAAGGGIGYGIGKGISMLARPITPSADVAKLVSEGIIPTPGQAARSNKTILGRAMANIEDAATSIPLLGDLIKGARGRAGEQLQTAAFARTTPAGIPVTEQIGRAGLDETAGKISNAYQTALDRIGTVKVDNQLLTGIEPAMRQAAPAMTNAQLKDIGNVVKNIISFGGKPTAGTAISADVAKGIDQTFGQAIRGVKASNQSPPMAAEALTAAQKEWRNLIARNAPDQATTDLLNEANRAFANYIRVERAVGKGGTVSGEFTAPQLAQAVRETVPGARKVAYAKGTALMQDLSDPAKNVLMGRLNESGTIPRGLVGLGLLGGGGAAVNEQLGGPDWLTKLGIATALMGPLYTGPGSQYMIGQLAPKIQGPLANAATATAPYLAQIGRFYLPQNQK